MSNDPKEKSSNEPSSDVILESQEKHVNTDWSKEGSQNPLYIVPLYEEDEEMDDEEDWGGYGEGEL